MIDENTEIAARLHRMNAAKQTPYESIKAGLEDALAWSQGDKSRGRTVVVEVKRRRILGGK